MTENVSAKTGGASERSLDNADTASYSGDPLSVEALELARESYLIHGENKQGVSEAEMTRICAHLEHERTADPGAWTGIVYKLRDMADGGDGGTYHDTTIRDYFYGGWTNHNFITLLTKLDGDVPEVPELSVLETRYGVPRNEYDERRNNLYELRKWTTKHKEYDAELASLFAMYEGRQDILPGWTREGVESLLTDVGENTTGSYSRERALKHMHVLHEHDETGWKALLEKYRNMASGGDGDGTRHNEGFRGVSDKEYQELVTAIEAESPRQSALGKFFSRFRAK